MTDRPLRRLAAGQRPVRRREDIDAAVTRFYDDMADVAAEFAATTAVEGFDVEVPDLDDHARQRLRRYLEHEVLAIEEGHGEQTIPDHVLRQEKIKQALVTLKTTALRRVAENRGLRPARSMDQLAQQIAVSYDWDEEAVARLVLDHTKEPEETLGGHVTRLFVLREPVQVEPVAARLSYVDGYYYRTWVARWFVFSNFRRQGSVMHIDGRVQSLKAEVNPEDETQLIAKQEAQNVRLEIRDGSNFARVHDARSPSVARSMLAAFKTATKLERLEYVPRTGTDVKMKAHALHPSTLFLLDLLTHRLTGHLFRQRDPVLARFRLTERAMSADSYSGRDEQGGADRPSRRPELSAVRFEGRNLLDSLAACGLMWLEGRPLVDVTVQVGVASSQTDSTIRARLPIRLAIEKDHVLVSTGLPQGQTDPAGVALEVHRAVLALVEEAIEDPVDQKRESALRNTIKRRAENGDPDAAADLLADQDLEVI